MVIFLSINDPAFALPRILKDAGSGCRSIRRPQRSGCAATSCISSGSISGPFGGCRGGVEDTGTHGRPHAPALLRPVAIEQNHSGSSLATLLARGEIDALIGSRRPEIFGRDPDVVRLFPDYRALERELYEQTRIFPIMHLIAMRR